MELIAHNVMSTRFSTLKPNLSVADAVRVFQKVSDEKDGRKVFGMMVTDNTDRLVGMLSMYDILLFVRPKHIHVWGTMDDIDISGLVDQVCDRTKNILVGDIMSTDLISVTPNTHLMALLDLMINKHVRRIPVLENGKILGIVYISDLFYHLLKKIAN